MIQTLTVGPVTLHLYGLILGVAIAVGWAIAGRLVKQVGVKEAEFERLTWLGVGGGLVGARLYHVMDYWWYYQQHWAEIIAVWNGGLGIWGAVLGGAASIWLFGQHYKHVWGKVLDAGAAVLPLSQAIGRWGNYVNQELFGLPTKLPWKLYIPPANRPPGYEAEAYFHPVFLYESILNVGLFLALRMMWKKGWVIGSGNFLGGYLIGYGLIRGALEPLKIGAWRLGPLYTAQWFSVAAMGIGLTLMRRGRQYNKRDETQ